MIRIDWLASIIATIAVTLLFNLVPPILTLYGSYFTHPDFWGHFNQCTAQHPSSRRECLHGLYGYVNRGNQ